MWFLRRKRSARRPASQFDELLEWFPGERLIRDRGELRVYECDAFPMRKGLPGAVVLCESRADVVAAVRWCHRRSLPFVPRGAGTGLSGGATPVPGCLLIDLGRMRRILKIDIENRFAVVEPGLVSIRLSDAVREEGFHFAPDPSSEKACTIGGNVAENSGGPHCLKYGVTVDHVLGLEVVLPDGEVARLGGPRLETSLYDLKSLFVGAEGTFGVVTEVTVRLTRNPRGVRTFLAIFDRMSLACRMVAEITRQGIVPAALEIMDQLTIRAVEASVNAAGYPKEAAAVLLIELDGFDAEMDEDEDRIRRIAEECRALRFSSARREEERLKLWKGRKGVFGTMGRINTDLYVLDGVVPRTRLEATLEKFCEIAARRGVTLSNLLHAGDGNLHPNISYDGRDPQDCARALAAGREMLLACVEAGGSITGEHGVGLEKAEFLPLCLDEDDLDLQRSLRRAIDSAGLANPGKIFPAASREGAEPAARSAEGDGGAGAAARPEEEGREPVGAPERSEEDP
ncbi:MAG: FAD-binding protein [Planctomycetes bacterium]|nr:FAD-binding protein [Planctomycetota bacterium]